MLLTIRRMLFSSQTVCPSSDLEFVERDMAVQVMIKFIHHRLKLSLVKDFPEVPRHSPKVLDRYLHEHGDICGRLIPSLPHGTTTVDCNPRQYQTNSTGPFLPRESPTLGEKPS